ncbi:hypothetical protein BDV09DRAFT_197931 [Aspergillus tetrazonus]
MDTFTSLTPPWNAAGGFMRSYFDTAASAGKAARDFLQSHERFSRACLCICIGYALSVWMLPVRIPITIEGITTSLEIPQIQRLDQGETILQVHADPGERIRNQNDSHTEPSIQRNEAWLEAVRQACGNSAEAETQLLAMHRGFAERDTASVSVSSADGGGQAQAFQQVYLFKCGDVADVLDKSDDARLNRAVVHNVMIGAHLNSRATGALSISALAHWVPQLTLAAELALTALRSWNFKQKASSTSGPATRPARSRTVMTQPPVPKAVAARPIAGSGHIKRPFDAEIRAMAESQIIELGTRGQIPLYSLERRESRPL